MIYYNSNNKFRRITLRFFFIFSITNEPGITASVAYKTPSGTTEILAFNILLADILKFTEKEDAESLGVVFALFRHPDGEDLEVLAERPDDERRLVHRFATLAVGLVVIQGVLGGMRVTGGFTLSTSEADMAPSIALAVTHGVMGQVFLGLIVGLAVVTSTAWLEAPAAEKKTSAGMDRILQMWLVAALLLQLVLGAVQRHMAQGLIIHISLAAVVVMIAVMAGARAWGLYHGVRPVQQLGQLLMAGVAVQVTLGIAALAVTQGRAVVGAPTTLEVTIATAHQATGAFLLALSVALLLWTRRLFEPE